MAFIPVPDTAEFVLGFTGPGGNEMVNTLYLREATIGTWSAAGLQNGIDVLESWWDVHVQPLVSNEVALTAIRARDLSIENGAVVVEGMNYVGANGSPALPQNVTFAVSFRTGLAGRSFRGRNYFVGLAENQVAGNNVVLATANAIKAAYETLFFSILVADIKAVVVSRFSNGAPRVTGVATDINQVLYVDLRVDTMRRRLD